MAVTKTIKMDDEVGRIYEEKFTAEKEKNPLLTNGEFLEIVLKTNLDPYPAPQDVDNSKIDELQATIAEIQHRDNVNITLLANAAEMLNCDISDIGSTLKNLLKTENATPELANDEVIVKLPKVHKLLIDEVCSRLSADDCQVSPRDLFLDMFFRYEVQRFNEWFYPHVIKDSEFEGITGYTRKQLLELCIK